MRPQRISLPDPRTTGDMSLEAALKRRRSVRAYTPAALRLEEVSQLLWAAQGITGRGGLRTAPSAGALYPLEVYLVSGEVEGLAQGIYRYMPLGHQLQKVAARDCRPELASAALGQEFVRDAAVSIVVAAVYRRMAITYGERSRRYIDTEVGCVSENVSLQAAALNLGTVIVGAFYDAQVQQVVGLRSDEEPLCILPVGRR
jgi:SagB-type dehydrogenase family enzyme